ncbi:hypothetical protein HNR65_002915 [Desulfosalsimonas propionicica]|uniref:Uncharacterized protein n=1 Tax=Desulfosalsimonas propionicica TaxID=332175 RepID=A0A7W0CBB9_9BACT|nr:hypothetical protein [Desulfosalsimonas propionicica]MBA2882563.1 hypothetical protein [Desulfosalsimonas propionicica]
MAAENDIVLIYHEDQPVVFARVEEIRPDVKKDWFQIKLMLLQVPVQTVTWILRDTYINGGEFTMGGNRMRLEKIEPPEDQEEPEEQVSEKQEAAKKQESGTNGQDSPDDSGGTVISLKDRKPK